MPGFDVEWFDRAAEQLASRAFAKGPDKFSRCLTRSCFRRKARTFRLSRQRSKDDGHGKLRGPFLTLSSRLGLRSWQQVIE